MRSCMNEIRPITVKLEGGLGNQIFQLAAGYYLAAKLNTSLCIDQYSIPITTAHGERQWGFEEFYDLVLPEELRVDVLSDLPNQVNALFARRYEFIRKILLKLRFEKVVKNNECIYSESNSLEELDKFFNIRKPVRLHGNFQSWKIVEEASKFGFPKILNLKITPSWVLKMKEEIDLSNSIALHFRVGDDALTNVNFKQPSVGYYLEALKILKKFEIYSHIFVLSDDISRVKKLYGHALPIETKFLEMPLEATPAERLYVLSLFGGIVCANSTFCGWAAWSIYNSGGKVVVPIPYSDGTTLGSRDFPESWIQIDKYL